MPNPEVWLTGSGAAKHRVHAGGLRDFTIVGRQKVQPTRSETHSLGEVFITWSSPRFQGARKCPYPSRWQLVETAFLQPARYSELEIFLLTSVSWPCKDGDGAN